MNPGDLLLHLNPLLLLASLAAGALHLRDGDAEKRLLQRVSLGLLLGSLTASLLLLGSYFYRTALEFEYVADYSALELPLRYKLAGVWAGRDGTLLIWCWAAALALNWELWRGAMADGAGGARRRGDTHRNATDFVTGKAICGGDGIVDGGAQGIDFHQPPFLGANPDGISGRSHFCRLFTYCNRIEPAIRSQVEAVDIFADCHPRDLTDLDDIAHLRATGAAGEKNGSTFIRR
mgnify:CR=1 FL=1